MMPAHRRDVILDRLAFEPIVAFQRVTFQRVTFQRVVVRRGPGRIAHSRPRSPPLGRRLPLDMRRIRPARRVRVGPGFARLWRQNRVAVYPRRGVESRPGFQRRQLALVLRQAPYPVRFELGGVHEVRVLLHVRRVRVKVRVSRPFLLHLPLQRGIILGVHRHEVAPVPAVPRVRARGHELRRQPRPAPALPPTAVHQRHVRQVFRGPFRHAAAAVAEPGSRLPPVQESVPLVGVLWGVGEVLARRRVMPPLPSTCKTRNSGGRRRGPRVRAEVGAEADAGSGQSFGTSSGWAPRRVAVVEFEPFGARARAYPRGPPCRRRPWSRARAPPP